MKEPPDLKKPKLGNSDSNGGVMEVGVFLPVVSKGRKLVDTHQDSQSKEG